MPELDGLEVCRRIRTSPWARDMFVLVVTGRVEGDDVVNALDAGADDYLFKPFTPSSITARLEIAERRIAANEARWAAEEALSNAQWMAGDRPDRARDPARDQQSARRTPRQRAAHADG